MLAVNLKMIEQFVELNINYMSIICRAQNALQKCNCAQYSY